MFFNCIFAVKQILLVLVTAHEIRSQIQWKSYIKNTVLTIQNKDVVSTVGLEKFTYLTKVELTSTNLANIDELKYLTGLASLILTSNQIMSIESLENLTDLRLSNNK